jgi:hypothetical protein
MAPSLRDDVGTGLRPVRYLGVALAVVTVVWGVAAAVSGTRAAADLDAARGALFVAEHDLRLGELASARVHLARASQRAAAASDRLHGPLLAPLRVVPLVRTNLTVATTLSDVVRDAGAAGVDVLQVVEAAAESERGSAAIPLDELLALHGPLQELARSLEAANATLRGASSARLISDIATARTTFLELSEPAAEAAGLGADLTATLPDLLGRDRPRRYLVGAGALSELRASGGLMGSWSLLTADEGGLDFSDFVDLDVLSSLDEDVTPPSAEYARRYGPLGGLRQWRNVNLTPDFPSAAQVMIELWEAQREEPLDGVIMVDAVVFQRLAASVGQLEVPGMTTLSPEETLRFVALDAYAAFDGDDDERKQVLGAVATAAFGQALDMLAADDWPTSMLALGELARGGHLRVYSRDPRVQASLERAGVAGGLPDPEGEFAAVFVNNIAGNKVDYFTQRRVEHRVELLPDGDARARIHADFSNSAPRAGYPRHVLGPWTDSTEAGDNLSLVTFMCGRRCGFDALPAGMTSGTTELGRPVADVHLLIPAGARRRAEVVTRTTDAWSMQDGELVLHVRHLLQPTLRETHLRLVIEIPDGWRPVGGHDGARLEGRELVWETAASGLVEVTVRLAGADSA